MPLETKTLRDDAVLRQKTGDDQASEATLGAAAKVKVRWVDRESQELTPDGFQVDVDAIVITDRDVEVGSVIWKGTTLAPTDGSTMLYKVVGQRTTTDLFKRYTRRRLAVQKLGMRMPATTS